MKLWELIAGIVTFALSYHAMRYVMVIFETDNLRKRDKDSPRKML
jgi:hypothetical protein